MEHPQLDHPPNGPVLKGKIVRKMLAPESKQAAPVINLGPAVCEMQLCLLLVLTPNH